MTNTDTIKNRALRDALAAQAVYGRAVTPYSLDLGEPRFAQGPAQAAPSGRDAAPIGSAADLGALVRARRLAMGLTQQQFADAAGVGRRFLSELEAGKPTVELGRALLVCQAAGIALHGR